MSDSFDRRSFLKKSALSVAAASVAAKAAPGSRKFGSAGKEWPVYGGDQGATRYSPLDEINRENVGNLKVAWRHQTGDAAQRPATRIQCTPIVVDGVMYLSTPRLKIQALDAATGKLQWSYDPFSEMRLRGNPGVNRGVCYWEDGDDKRIFVVIKDRLLSIDAKTGEPDRAFGDNGRADLTKDFDHNMAGLNFRSTSPVVVYQDVVILGGGGGEGPYPEAPGHIRGYDARTGKRRWIFHTIPKAGEYGVDTWESDTWIYAGGTNCWAGMSVDVERGWVFAGVGSPSFDFYGGNRKGMNLFGNCVLALDALTGERKWHFQTVHHDVWDWDLPNQPVLAKVHHNGREIDAVVQTTKQSFVFVLDRDTGEPLFPVEERPVPQSDVPNEELWPTQPFVTKPPPLSRQGFFPEDVTDVTPEAHAYVKEIYDKADAGQMFTPPSKRGTVIHPGFRGGALWGGSAFDPRTNTLFVDTDENTNIVRLADARPDQPFRYALPDRIQFRDQDGHPAIKPPWNHLTAVDLNKGEFAWRIVNGEYPDLKAKGIRKTGTSSEGGCIATGGDLVFIAATLDAKFRAFDSKTGKVLFEDQLKVPGLATPCTYEAGGKQFVCIAVGGGFAGWESNDEFVAYALP